LAEPAPSRSADPMHDRDRVFYLILTWSTIPAALIASCAIAWASGQLSIGWSVSGIAAGFLGMAAATIYALQKKPPAPRYPGPIIIGIACLTWALIGWQAWIWFHPPIQPTSGYTEAQLNEAVAKAKETTAKPLKEQLDQANNDVQNLRLNVKQLTDALAKATAQSPTQSDTPLGVDKLPTSMKLLFKGTSVEEIDSKNVLWTPLLAWRERQNVFVTQPFPAWAIIVVFKKPLIFTGAHVEDHGAGVPDPQIISDNPKYAVLIFDAVPYNSLLDITFTNEHKK
jgi:hypothetical protein